LLSTTPQKCTFDRRRKHLSGCTAQLRSTDDQSQRKFENERCTATSHQKRQQVNVYREISTLATFFSIACLQLAFPHVETLKYIYLLLICDAVHSTMTSQLCNTNPYCMLVSHACIHAPMVYTFTAEAENSPLCDRHSGSTQYGKPTLDLQVALSASPK